MFPRILFDALDLHFRCHEYCSLSEVFIFVDKNVSNNRKAFVNIAKNMTRILLTIVRPSWMLPRKLRNLKDLGKCWQEYCYVSEAYIIVAENTDRTYASSTVLRNMLVGIRRPSSVIFTDNKLYQHIPSVIS